MEALRTLAFEFDVEIETIGVPGQWSKNLKGMRNSVHYLQEIRGTIISINKFLNRYSADPHNVPIYIFTVL